MDAAQTPRACSRTCPRPSRVATALVKPSRLIIDEVGRCRLDRERTNLFFDVVDRRYEKEGPNTLILTTQLSKENKSAIRDAFAIAGRQHLFDWDSWKCQ